MTAYADARARVAEYIRQAELATRPPVEVIHGVFTDSSAEMADLTLADLKVIMAGPQEAPVLAHSTKNGEGLYALTRLANTLPEGPARDMAREVVRRPYAAALATVLIAAQLGSRSSWSGADELQGISETLGFAGLPLDDPAKYRAVADQFGIEHDEEEEFEDEG